MKKATINIQNEANIQANGVHNYGNNKPVICIETGEVFVSVLDAAEHIGCHYTNISLHLRGKQKTCKGKHYCYLSRVTESLDAIVARLRETSAVEADAKKWQVYQAEQEAIRKVEEKRLEDERKAREKYEADVVKAMAKIERCAASVEHLKAQLAEAEKRQMVAEMEYEDLIDEGKEAEVA